MANLGNSIYKKKFIGKVMTIQQFRKKYAEQVSIQAIDYAIANDMIDHVVLSPRVRLIVLTDKTIAYSPKSHPSRRSRLRT